MQLPALLQMLYSMCLAQTQYVAEAYGCLSSFLCKTIDNTGFIQKIATIFQGLFKDFSRTTLDFQGPPTRNTISQIVQKCTFASPTSLHFSVHLS